MPKSQSQHRKPNLAWVLTIVALFLSCVIVCIPAKAVPAITVVRRPMRSVLRTVGLEQYWTMFVTCSWEPVELKIVSVDDSGTAHDSTRALLKASWPFRHVLDDPLPELHYRFASGKFSHLLPSYASAIRHEIGGNIREIRFERIRTTAERNVTEPIAEFSWQR